ncbi:MAG: hypothetical protein IJZ13_07240, partial [Clostridia bacterium]|nr:hypothetical protein [Clostridia bacterium]
KDKIYYIKKWLIFTLVIGMLASLTACGASEAVDGVSNAEPTTTVSETTTTTESTTETTVQSTTVTTTTTTTSTTTTTTIKPTTKRTTTKATTQTTQKPQPTTVPTTKATTAPVTTDQPSIGGFTFGEVAGYSYKSDYLGLGCQLDNVWHVASRVEILEMNGFATDITDAELEQKIAETKLLYDLYATSEGGESITVIVERSDPATLATLDLNDLYTQLIPTYETIFENMGASSVKSAITTVTVDGKDYVGMDLTITMPNTTIYETQFAFICDTYLVSVTVATPMSYRLDDLLDTFYHL